MSLYKHTDDDKKYFEGDLRKLDGMDADVVSRIKAASKETGVKLPLTSGYRSQKRQDELFAAHPDPRWVARTSAHTSGVAADIGGVDGKSRVFWNNNPRLIEAMERQGLHRPMSWEPWHWEGPRTKDVENRKKTIQDLIRERNSSEYQSIPIPESNQPAYTPLPYRHSAISGESENGSFRWRDQSEPDPS